MGITIRQIVNANIEGYHSYFAEAYKKGYIGVALYTKEEPISIQKAFGIEEFDREGRTIMAEYPEFILFNIYFPNGKAREERLKYKLDFYEAFQKYAVNLAKKAEQKMIGKNYGDRTLTKINTLLAAAVWNLKKLAEKLKKKIFVLFKKNPCSSIKSFV